MALVVLPACSLIAGDFEIVPDVEEACTRSCNHEFLLGCAGDEKVLLETCLTEGQCDSERGLCTTCMAGDTRCNGSVREVCSADQTSWERLADCAPQQCNKTHCGACTPNEVQCAGAESRDLLFCTPDGTYVSMGTCGSATLCEQSVDRYRTDMTQAPACIGEVCPAGMLGCLGETLRRCRTAGDGWDDISTCLSAAVCELTVQESSGDVTPTCSTGCSPAGTFRCNGMLLEQCASNSTAWLPIEDCAASGLLCDSTLGACGGPCTPGSYRCNSATLEVCDPTETWVLSSECATPALCVATQDLLGAWRAECLPPVCDPEMIRCNPDDPRLLERCNADRTGYTLMEACASAALCRANDGRCDEPECMPGEGGVLPLQCDSVNPLVVQQCRADLTGFDPLQTCAEGEFCYPQDPADPCKTDCPARYLCNGAELWECTPEGTTLVAECATATLCDCVLTGTCDSIGPSGCGVPVCGGVLPEYRCVGSFLERCETGRNGWQAGIDCGTPELCNAGTAPEFEAGYCELCENVGEVRCTDDATGHHTCGPEGRSWVQDTSCPQGCLAREATNADYCAACATDETRCEGTMPGSARVRRCTADRSSLDAGVPCPYGCIDDRLTDRCAACVTGERRCNGSSLTECNASRSALTPVMTCGQSCIDNGTNDYCGTCVPGTTQCDGDTLETCGTDGNWDEGDACTHACIPRNGNDVCAPECDPGAFSCSGAQLRVCNSDGEWENHTLCASANHCDRDRGECDQCLAGEYSCSGTTLRSCDANGRWVAATSACNGTTLRTCPGGAVTTPTAQTCTLCDATNRECDDCSAQTPYSCSQGTLRQCDTTGHWNSSNILNCSGTTLRTCSGNTLSTRTCTATETCNESANACYECTPGAYDCDGTSLMVCDSTGHWVASPACVGSTERSCNGGAVETRPCPGSQTCNAAGTECNQCNNGDTRCGTGTIQTCNMRKWADTASCDPYSCVLSGGVATCGNCSVGTPDRCDPADPLQPQTCMGSLWTDMGMACTGACVSGNCVACDDAADCGAGRICSMNSCVQCTSTNTTACGATTPVCLNNTCVACMPPATRCLEAQPQTCSTAGAWTNSGMACTGDTPVCSSGACQCMNGALRCNDDQPEICMAGTFMPNGDACPADQVCMAGACVAP